MTTTTRTTQDGARRATPRTAARAALGLALAAGGLGLAQAQPAGGEGVQIYGLIDIGLAYQNGGTATMAGGHPGAALPGTHGLASAAQSGWQVRQGWASRLGLRIRETLGGGYAVGAQLEHRFSPDTGVATPGDPFWAGTSKLQLHTPHGELYLGRETLPAFAIGMAGDPFDYGQVGTLGRLHAFGGYVSADHATTGRGPATAMRHDNAVGYRSPVLAGGWSGHLAYSLDEGGRGPLGRSMGASVQYRAGPAYLGLGWDRARHREGGHDPQLLVASASYDFGVVRPIVSWSRSRWIDGDGLDGYSIGARLPVGGHLVRALAARTEPRRDGPALLKLAVGYEHVLSRRTSLYADLATARLRGQDRTHAADLGIRHRF